MTGSTSASNILVLDAMGLDHFALADRLDVFRDLLIGSECWTTVVVEAELRTGAVTYPALDAALTLDWVHVAKLDAIEEVRCFAKWVDRIGSGDRDRGEASVFAVAELLEATAICDDRAAVRVARQYLPSVHGNLWLLASACKDGKLTMAGAASLIDDLRSTGLRLPCTGAEFEPYARERGLL